MNQVMRSGTKTMLLVAVLSTATGIAVVIAGEKALWLLIVLSVLGALYGLVTRVNWLIPVIVFGSGLSFAYTYFVGGVPTDIPVYWRLLKDALVGLVLVNWALTTSAREKMQALLRERVFLFWFVCNAAYLVVRLAVSPTESIVTSTILLRYYLIYPFTFVAGASLLDSRVKVEYFIRWLLLAESVVGFLGILSAFDIGNNYAPFVTFGRFTFTRAISTLGNPNNLAVFLGFGILLQLAVTIFKHKRILPPSIWGKIVLSLMCASLFLTYSQGTILTVSALISILYLTKVKRSPLIFFGIAVLFTVMLGVGFATGTGSESLVLKSARDRLSNFHDLLAGQRLTSSEIWFGRGLSSVGTATSVQSINLSAGLLSPRVQMKGGIYTDNTLVTLFLTIGVVGAFFFVTLPLTAAFRAFKASRRLRDPYLKGTAVGICMICILTLLYGQFIDVASDFPMNLFFWFLCGLATNLPFFDSAKYSMEARERTVSGLPLLQSKKAALSENFPQRYDRGRHQNPDR